MVAVAARPPELHGCWQTWSERDSPMVVRTPMENQRPKVRRRFTGVHRIANVSVTMEVETYEDFIHWYRVLCQSGVLPTMMFEPNGVESIWRFSEPIQIDWPTPEAYRVSAVIEKLPGW